MTLFEQFTAATAAGVPMNMGDVMRCEAICQRIRGYSDGKHYAFFKTLLALPAVKDVLILGVYHGRDIAFMRDVLLHAGRSDVWIVGVDKFSDTPCADWPVSASGKNWEQAGFGVAPTLQAASANLGCNEPGPVILVESDDASFLHSTDRRFDAVYLDTSHDYETVMRQLRQVRRVCRPGAIICGDDYSDVSNAAGGHWGVRKAVSESFLTHSVFAEWIWVSGLELLKPAPLPADDCFPEPRISTST